jgi:hypothetical protein
LPQDLVGIYNNDKIIDTQANFTKGTEYYSGTEKGPIKQILSDFFTNDYTIDKRKEFLMLFK